MQLAGCCDYFFQVGTCGYINIEGSRTCLGKIKIQVITVRVGQFPAIASFISAVNGCSAGQGRRHRPGDHFADSCIDIVLAAVNQFIDPCKIAGLKVNILFHAFRQRDDSTVAFN